MASESNSELFFKQQAWVKHSSRPLSSRIDNLKKLRDWVENHRIDIQQAIINDFSKPSAETDLTEIYAVLSEIKYALKNLHQWVRPVKVSTPVAMTGTSSDIQYRPKGVCLILAPWNFPINLTIGPLVSALAAGNAVIVKPSELTPHCCQLIARMAEELFDSAEVAVVNGGVGTAKQLLQLPFDHIFFTGSPRVGKIVMEQAAKHLCSVTLELGGKSPAVVDETADIEDAAEKLVWGKFLNCGQTCIAPDYILVHESQMEQLIEQLIKCIDKYFDPDGEGIDNSDSYGRIINKKHLNRLKMLLEDAQGSGAIPVCGGVIDNDQLYFAPTVLWGVDKKSKIMQEEIFGPILPVLGYQELAQAIAIINEKPKPLALYIFSKSTESQDQILDGTSSGSVGINDCLIQYMNPGLPFGGEGNSGFGRSHGFAGFKAFSNERSMLVQKTGLTSVKPLYPPYTTLTQKVIDLLLKYL